MAFLLNVTEILTIILEGQSIKLQIAEAESFISKAWAPLMAHASSTLQRAKMQPGFPIWRCSMPFSLITLSRVDMPVSQAEGLKILERDQFCCRYC